MPPERLSLHRSAVILFVLCAGVSLSHAQTSFKRTYGGTWSDWGASAQQTFDGGYIFVGWTYSFGAGFADVYLIRTNSSGDTLWTRTYGGTNGDLGYSVQQTSDSGYIVAGSTLSFGAGWSDVYLIKTNSSGDTLWTRTYGGTSGEECYSVLQTSDGGYIVAGSTNSFGAGSLDVYLIKANSSGDTLWTRTYGGTNGDLGYSVQETSDGGCIITGMTGFNGIGSGDVFLARTNSSGDTLWTRTYGGTDTDEGYSVHQTSDNGYIIAGSINHDVCLIKTNSSGATLWMRTYGGIGDQQGSSVQQTSDGGYIVTGLTHPFSEDVYLIKTNSSGDTLWTRTYGGTASDGGNSVRQTSDGGYIIAGFTNFSGWDDSGDMYLIKTLADGIVHDDRGSTPAGFALLQNYPNPFNPATVISYQIPVRCNVTLMVYDVLGRNVSTLVDEIQEPGTKSVEWVGAGVSSGIYFYRLFAGPFIQTKKLVLLR